MKRGRTWFGQPWGRCFFFRKLVLPIFFWQWGVFFKKKTEKLSSDVWPLCLLSFERMLDDFERTPFYQRKLNLAGKLSPFYKTTWIRVMGYACFFLRGKTECGACCPCLCSQRHACQVKKNYLQAVFSLCLFTGTTCGIFFYLMYEGKVPILMTCRKTFYRERLGIFMHTNVDSSQRFERDLLHFAYEGPPFWKEHNGIFGDSDGDMSENAHLGLPSPFIKVEKVKLVKTECPQMPLHERNQKTDV